MQGTGEDVDARSPVTVLKKQTHTDIVMQLKVSAAARIHGIICSAASPLFFARCSIVAAHAAARAHYLRFFFVFEVTLVLFPGVMVNISLVHDPPVL